MINEQHIPEEEERLQPDESEDQHEETSPELSRTTRLSGMYRDWFLEYASYVILERAVPEVRDGLKPVQRRILHAMKELDDGRYNKVANIIGHTMKYHPHGDASIGDALVQLGQKDLLIDTQGNWGNILTGDSAAAPRYIEARLSKFALEVVFNPKTTRWKTSYDGRNKEPVTLPVKFPLLLAQGVEGIAVGLASKILPHNFNELLEASILYLKGEEPNIVPDFPSGGYADFSKYMGGMRGGRVRIRAKINIQDKRTLIITEIPFGTTTNSLIDSIVTANDKGKIKIRKIEDNTADKVEILVHLAPGISPDQAIDALYLFTDCEISISPNCSVIDVDKPRFLSVNEILKISTDNTVEQLKSELELERDEMLEQLLYSSLEKIFIEHRIYRDIESCESWEAVIKTIDKGLEPFKKEFYREITRDDIIHLTEIKIKRISRYDAFRAEKEIKKLEERLEKARHHLENLVVYTINYFRDIKKKYGAGRERRTEIRYFDSIEATRVAVANEKLYVNRAEGFAGTALKKDEFVCECSDIDDIIVFREDGTYMVTKVSEKSFVGKNVIHIGVFERNDERTIYNVIYRDGLKGAVNVKRFPVKGVTRDKEYDLTKGTKGSKVLYFTANPNGEAEVVSVYLRPKPRMKKTVFDFDFSQLAIKGRGSVGNILSKNAVRRIVLKDEGVSTLGAIDIWFDDAVLRLNSDGRGKHLGAFKGDEKILALYASGNLRVMNFDLSNHFEEQPLIIQKLNPGTVITAIYKDADQGYYYIKRFEPEVNGKMLGFIGDNKDNKLILVTTEKYPRLAVTYPPSDRRQKSGEEIDVEDFIAVKSYKARGKRVSATIIDKLKWLEPVKKEEAEEQTAGSDDSPDEKTADLPEEKTTGKEAVAALEKAGTSPAEVSASEDVAEDLPRPIEKRKHKPPQPGDKERQIRLDLDI
ncbi:MAG: DNA gyrase/topoisomerase IV subunit A [Bacteroidales bacterium]|nr:DNA gyrase/topoisomerase IV subunit A [Bacteroidales bacterium]